MGRIGAHPGDEPFLEVEEQRRLRVLPRPPEETDDQQVPGVDQSMRLGHDEQVPEPRGVGLPDDHVPAALGRLVAPRPGALTLVREQHPQRVLLPARVSGIREGPAWDVLAWSELDLTGHAWNLAEQALPGLVLERVRAPSGALSFSPEVSAAQPGQCPGPVSPSL